MIRRVFYSFRYDFDHWRASQVRRIGSIEGERRATDNEWESVRRNNDATVQRWIDSHLAGRSCTIFLIGSGTAGRRWINYEIKKSWSLKMGLVGIHIHNLKDQDQKQTVKGQNPIDTLNFNGTPLNSIIRTYDPPFSESRDVYAHISENIGDWIEEAITIRGHYP